MTNVLYFGQIKGRILMNIQEVGEKGTTNMNASSKTFR